MSGKLLFRFALTLGMAFLGLVMLLGMLAGAEEPVRAAEAEPVVDLAEDQSGSRSLPLLEPASGGVRGLAASPRVAGLYSPAAAASNAITVCSAGCDYSSVQAAVDAASSGDVIKVAQGVYGSAATCVVEIVKTLTLQGGYTTTGEAGWQVPDIDGQPTVLDGGGGSQVVCITGGDPTVEGFHIRNGYTATSGAGVYIAGGEPIVRRNRVYENAADADGGGVYVAGGAPVLENNLIYTNMADNGGGIYVVAGAAAIRYNTLYDNEASVLGGGVYLGSASSAISASIVVSNVATSGSGIYVDADGQVAGQVLYNNFFNNDYSNQSGSAVLGDNIYKDPQFVGPIVGVDSSLVNLRLTADSDCIGRFGDEYPDEGPVDDYDGYGRPFGSWPDIGAHEFHAGTCFARIDSGQVYTAVQSAVSAFDTVENSVIKVAGHCTGTGASAIELDKALTLRGGYTLTNWSDPDPELYPTRLDGERARRVLNVESGATIEGFDIHRGYDTSAGGGGIRVVSGDVLIQNNRIYDNQTLDEDGAGIYIGGGYPTVRSNAIYSNAAGGSGTRGGGIRLTGDVLIEDNRIFDNSAVRGGGGIFVFGGGATVRNNDIYTNTAGEDGGGIGIAGGSNATIEANQVYSNSALERGGGVFIDSSSPTIEENEIYGNRTYNAGQDKGGGGIFINSPDSPVIRGNLIHDNKADNGSSTGGGGIHVNTSGTCNVTIERNAIYNNVADAGGGIRAHIATLNASAHIRNNLVYSNTATTSDGGGIRISPRPIFVLENNTIYGNRALLGDGGGIYDAEDRDGSNYISNTIIVGNVAQSGGGYYRGTGDSILGYNDVWGNVGGNYGNMGSVVTPTDISQDPLFEDPTAADFRLQVGSPCIDAADPDYYPADDTDGYVRPVGIRADMGAHEHYPGTCFARVGSSRVYTTVQDVVDIASVGDEVRVVGLCEGSQGTVTIGKALVLRGGFTKANWITPTSVTVLDAQGQGRVVTITGASNMTVTVGELVIRNGTGTGIYVATPLSPTIQNVIAYDNGDGIHFAAGGNPRLYNNTFANNTADGIELVGSGTPIISNTIVVSNTGSGIVGGSPLLAYNDVWNNGTDYGGGLLTGTTDISVDPLFQDPSGGDYQLRFDSPCIHTADPNSGVAWDFEGDVRPDGTGSGERYDIGADEAVDYLGVSLEPDQSRQATSGEMIEYTYYLTNTSTRVGDFAVDSELIVIPASGDTTAGQWRWGHASSYDDLVAGEGVAVPITVSVPTGAFSGTRATLLVTATYQSVGVDFFDVASNTTLVKSDWALDLAPTYGAQTGDPGQLVTYTHVLTNGGGTDVFTLTWSSSLGWATVDPPGPVHLGSGGSAPIYVYVTVPAWASAQAIETTILTATSAGAKAALKTVRDTVTDTTSVTDLYGDRYVATEVDGGDDRAGNNNCLIVGSPCASIGQALAQAHGGEMVKVAAGTYNEYDLRINESIVLRGGYATDGWTTDLDPTRTVVDAGQTGRVLRIGSDNPVVEGFTFQNGEVQGQNGGGVFVSSGSEAILRGNIISGNVARVSGVGGVGGSGGGVYNSGSDITLERIVLANNEAERSGGGLYNSGGTPSIWNNLLYENVSADDGGGLYNAGGTPLLWHNTFFSNTADSGGGLHLAGGAPIVSNTIAISNTAFNDGGGIFWAVGTVGHNNAWGNTPNDYNSAKSRPSTDIFTNPLFADIAARDFHLLRDSDCRDVGDGSVLGVLDEDLDEQPRGMNGGPDIGADEYQRTDVDLSPGTTKIGKQSVWVSYTHKLTNTGNYRDYYHLTWQSEWPVMVNGYVSDPVTVPVGSMLNSGADATVEVLVQVPDGEVSSTVKSTIITATSQVAEAQGENDVYDVSTDLTVAGLTIDVALEPLERDGWANNTRSAVYTHTLINTGNYTDQFNLESWSVGEVSIFWDTTPPLLPTSVELGPGESTTVYMTITVPSGAAETEWNVAGITATSQADNGVLAVVTDTTIAGRTFGMLLEPVGSSCSTEPGNDCIHEHVLTNEGNYTDTFEIIYTSTVEGWPVTIEPATIIDLGGTVRPNANTTETVRIVVSIPYMTDEPPAFGGEREWTVVTATSQAVPTVTVSFTDISTATQLEGVYISPNYANYYEAGPGQNELLSRVVVTSGMGSKGVVFDHDLVNNSTSNSTDTFTLTVSSVTASSVVVPDVTGEVAWHGTITDVYVTVTVASAPDHPPIAPVHRTQLTATSHFSPTGDNGQDTVVDIVVVNQWVSAAWSPGGSQSGPPDGPPGYPDGGVVYTHLLTNTGNFTDSFELSGKSSWSDYGAVEFAGEGLINDMTPDIGAGESMVISVTVPVPYDVPCYELGTATITATSRTPTEGVYDHQPEASATDNITVEPYYYVDLGGEVERRYVSGGTVVLKDYTHWLTNTSNCTNIFDLGGYDLGPGVFTPTVVPARTTVLSSMLEADYEPTLVTVTVAVPATDTSNLVWGRVVITAEGDSGGLDSLGSITDTMIVNQRVELELWPDRSTIITVGNQVPAIYTHTLRNAGNYTDSFRMDLQNEDGWSVRVIPSDVPPLPPQATQEIEVRVTVNTVKNGVPPTVTNQTWFTATSLSPEDQEAVVVYTPTATVVDTTLVRRPHVTLDPDYTRDVTHGTVWTYTHTLENSGGLTDTYVLTYESIHPSWVTVPLTEVNDLQPGQTHPITVVVSVPSGTSYLDHDETIVTATSQISPYAYIVLDTAVDTTNIPRNVAASLTPSWVDSGAPGESVVRAHTLENTGNYTEAFTLLPDANVGVKIDYAPDADVSTGDPPAITLEAGDSTLVTVTMSIPASAPGGYTEEVRIDIRHDELGLITSTVNIITIDYVEGTRFVDPSANGTDEFNNCTMRDGQDPCSTVQHAVEQAAHGDTIKVAELPLGSFYADVLGASQVVRVDKSVTLQGGYVNGDWIAFDPDENPTVLNGEGERRVLVVTAGITPTIEGFHLYNGYVEGNGAGVYVTAGATPTIQLNQIYDNVADGNGLGGGVYHGGGGGGVMRNKIFDNRASRGGGLYLVSGELAIWNNLFYGNVATVGGGLYNGDGRPQVWNNTFYNNTAAQGAGLHSAAGTLVVSNTIVVGNSNEGIRAASAASFDLAYNDVWGNSVADYAGDALEGMGSISEDPRFHDVAGADLRLTFNSPCINTGTPSVTLPDEDYEGNGRPLRGRHDIGAYEYGIVSTKAVSPTKAQVLDIVTYTVRITNTGSVGHGIVVTDALDSLLDFTQLLTTTGDGMYIGADHSITWTGFVSGNNAVEIITFSARITDNVPNFTPIPNVAWVDQGRTTAVTVTVIPEIGTRYVAPGGSDSSDCRGAATPCGTIQWAAGQAQRGDTVKVAAGTYTGIISVSKHITLTGGYAYLNPDTYNWRTLDPIKNVTTLDGQSLGNPCVVINSPVDGPKAATVVGFHMINGSAGGSVENGGHLRLHRSWVYDNDDGVNVDDGTFELTDNVVVQNTGAGLRVAAGSDGTAIHNTFARNTYGAFVNGSARFTNTIFYSHTVGVEAAGAGSADLSYTLWITYGTDRIGNVDIGSSNFYTDPVFVDPDGLDYHILETSGAIDVGAATSVNEDLDGEARWVRDAPDLGADEFPLGLNKYGPEFAMAGELITYTVELQAVDLGLLITDTLPKHVDYISGTLTCTEPSCSYLAAERAIVWTGDVSGVMYITYSVVITPWLGNGTVITNYAWLERAGRVDRSREWSTEIVPQPGVRYVAPAPLGVNVEGDGRENNCLVDWKPCATVQQAIDEAMDGDAVWVAGGTYIDSDNDSRVVFANKPITLLGGHTTTDWTRDPEANPTYLDGQGSDRGVRVSGTAGPVVIDGFRILNGYSGDDETGGGGLFASNATITLAHSWVYDNATGFNGRGGGIYVANADHAVLTGNRIYANTAFLNGGGIYLLENDQTILDGNYVLDNVVTRPTDGLGGGIQVENSGPAVITMTSNVVTGNSADGGGDGINLLGIIGTLGRLYHNTIADNDAGHGIRVEGYSVDMANTILAGHATGIRAVGANSHVTATRTLWDGSGTLDLVTGGATVVTLDTLTDDPMFVTDYHIQPTSPAFDTGVDMGVGGDVDGEQRPMGLAPDIGADELRVSLEVTKEPSLDPAPAGDELGYTIQVTNTGLLTLTVVVTDYLPAEVIPTGILTWTISQFQPGADRTFVFTVETTVEGALVNEVRVDAAEGAKDSYVVTSTVGGDPDITVGPRSMGELLAPDEMGSRILTLGNQGRAQLSWTSSEIPTVGWLSETPPSGNIDPSGSTQVAVLFDAAGLSDGRYTTTLRIGSNDPDTPLVDVGVALTVCTPVAGASFTYVPTSPYINQTITFSGSVTAGTGVVYTWDFGDGTGDTGQGVTNSYSEIMSYTVTMTATNCYGTEMDVDSETINITEVPGDHLSTDGNEKLLISSALVGVIVALPQATAPAGGCLYPRVAHRM